MCVVSYSSTSCVSVCVARYARVHSVCVVFVQNLCVVSCARARCVCVLCALCSYTSRVFVCTCVRVYVCVRYTQS